MLDHVFYILSNFVCKKNWETYIMSNSLYFDSLIHCIAPCNWMDLNDCVMHNISTITFPRRHTILPTPTHWVEKRLAILLIASKQDCIEYRVSYQLETVHQILIMRLRHGISHNLIVPIELRPQVKHMQQRIGPGHKLPILRKAMFPCSRYPLLRSRCLPSSQ